MLVVYDRKFLQKCLVNIFIKKLGITYYIFWWTHTSPSFQNTDFSGMDLYNKLLVLTSNLVLRSTHVQQAKILDFQRVWDLDTEKEL